MHVTECTWISEGLKRTVSLVKILLQLSLQLASINPQLTSFTTASAFHSLFAGYYLLKLTCAKKS